MTTDSVDGIWSSLRTANATVDLVYDEIHATLHATAFRVRRGIPVTLGFVVDQDCTTNYQTLGPHDEAAARATNMRRLRRIELDNLQLLAELSRQLSGADNLAGPWHLLIMLNGREHDFTVVPQFRGAYTLVLRVTNLAPGN